MQGRPLIEARFAELDNPIWNALVSAHSSFAFGTQNAKSYEPTVTTLAGVRDETEQCFADLLLILRPQQAVGLFLQREPEMPAQSEAKIVRSGGLSQFVCDKLIEPPTSKHRVIDLEESDIPQMLELTALAQPGPFDTRTIELGNYVGIKDASGRLICMAGQRCQTPSFVEISAVSTHPEFRGKGLAKLAVAEVVRRVFKIWKTPFLHARPDNTPAIRSYEALGFNLRRNFRLVVLKNQATNKRGNYNI